MVIIKNLTKIYETPTPFKALDNINLTLPSKGMVFIVGKSGSGKSTFLNILEALDNLTEGDIIADGINVNHLSEKDLSEYRNDYVGFIFQDYCLLNQLRVDENIAISLNLKGEESDQKVKEIIKLVGLEGFEKRYPKTLSAGQKQRVAIARGYIKKPKMILCDEPTGNLDSKTSEQILELLKSLSETTLVVVVSHNLDDAYKYGDRIIEISDGKIIGDISDTSNKETYQIKDKTLYLTNINSINDEDLNKINYEIQQGHVDKIQGKNSLFKETKVSDETHSKAELKNYKLSPKKKIKIAAKFQKKRLVSTLLICFFSAVVSVIFGLSQFFTLFNKNDIIKQSLQNNDQLVFSMKKASYSDTKKKNVSLSDLIAIEDADIQAVKDSKYKGEIYTLYNYSLPVSLRSWTLQNERSLNDSSNLRDFYLQEIYGVLPVDNNYLKQVFGEYTTVGNLAEKDNGIIITDYIADSIIHYRGEALSSYEEILGTYRNNSNSIYAYINGIINTNYKTKHASLINKFQQYENDPLHYDFENILMSDEYLSFYEDVKNYLGIAYSLNKDFITASNNVQIRNIARFDDSKISFANVNESIYLNNAFAYSDSLFLDIIETKLPENTLGISLITLNNLLNTHYTKDEVAPLNGQQITIEKFRHHHKNEDAPVYQKTVTIKIFDTGYFSYIASDDLLSFFRNYDMIPYSLYFNDLSSASYAYYALAESPFVPNSSYIEAGAAINNVVVIFNDFFVLIAILLVTGILLMLAFHSLNNINQNKYEIGVFKSLGMKEKDIILIFIYQIIFSTILISLFYGIGIVIFSRVANNILFNSFMYYLKNPALKAISIISFHPWVFVLDIVIILAINALTTLIPFIFLKKVKPLQILR